MERNYSFTIGQKVKMKDPYDSKDVMVYGNVSDIDRIGIYIRWIGFRHTEIQYPRYMYEHIQLWYPKTEMNLEEIKEGMIYCKGFNLCGSTMNKTKITHVNQINNECRIEEIEIDVGRNQIFTLIKNVKLTEILVKFMNGEIFLIDDDWNILKNN